MFQFINKFELADRGFYSSDTASLVAFHALLEPSLVASQALLDPSLVASQALLEPFLVACQASFEVALVADQALPEVVLIPWPTSLQLEPELFGCAGACCSADDRIGVKNNNIANSKNFIYNLKCYTFDERIDGRKI